MWNKTRSLARGEANAAWMAAWAAKPRDHYSFAFKVLSLEPANSFAKKRLEELKPQKM